MSNPKIDTSRRIYSYLLSLEMKPKNQYEYVRRFHELNRGLKERGLKVNGKTCFWCAGYIRGGQPSLSKALDRIEEDFFYEQWNYQERYKRAYQKAYIEKHGVKCSWDDSSQEKSCQEYLKGADTSMLVSESKKIRNRVKDEILKVHVMVIPDWFAFTEPGILPRKVKERCDCIGTLSQF